MLHSLNVNDNLLLTYGAELNYISAMRQTTDFDIDKLIQAAGGIAALAEKMGLDARKGYNQVCQWRQRQAIPAGAQVSHRKLFLRLAKKTA